jgi:hypothetical protein
MLWLGVVEFGLLGKILEKITNPNTNVMTLQNDTFKNQICFFQCLFIKFFFFTRFQFFYKIEFRKIIGGILI